jgi:trimeric autotransporter adhesin
MRKALSIFAILILLTALAFAAIQGPLGGTGSGAGWTGQTNIAVTDTVYATQLIPAAGPSTSLSSSTFGFTIPVGAVINGIQIDIVSHCSAINSCSFSTVQAGIGISITKVAGIATGTAKSNTTTWVVTDGTTTFGSAVDLWGTTWSPADINSTGFGTVFQIDNANGVSARTASIDSVLITVTFTPASTSSSQMFKVF